jgi:hypothetical protein
MGGRADANCSAERVQRKVGIRRVKRGADREKDYFRESKWLVALKPNRIQSGGTRARSSRGQGKRATAKSVRGTSTSTAERVRYDTTGSKEEERERDAMRNHTSTERNTQRKRKTHLINRSLPVPIKIRRLLLGLVRAAVADGERGNAVRVGGEL